MRNAAVLLLAPVIFLSVPFLCVEQTKAENAWRIALKEQLLKDKRCEIKELSRVKEFKLAGEDVVDGRAHCTDGIDYDFSWKRKLNKFELRRCQPAVC